MTETIKTQAAIKCKKCGSDMAIETTVKPKDNGAVRIVGYHAFCKNNSCSNEYDLKRGRDQ